MALDANQLSGFGSGGGAARADMSDAPQTNLLIHSRADVGITESGGAVSDWANSGSGTKFYAAAPVASANNTFAPTIVADGDVEGQKGAGYIQFDGSSERLATLTNNGSNIIHNFFIVMMIDTFKNAGQILQSTGGSATHLFMGQDSGSPTLTSETEGSPYIQSAFVVGEWMLVDCLWKYGATEAHIRVNDGSAVTASGTLSNSAGPGWSTHLTLMHTNHSSTGGAAGKVAEILAYNGEVSSGDLTNIQNYINDQYGLW